MAIATPPRELNRSFTDDKPQQLQYNGSIVEVVPDVACLPLSIVKLYFFGPPHAADREWVIIDAGLAFSTPSIRRAALDRFGSGSRPSAMILTHGHFDHVGALPDLAEEWDIPVFAHPRNFLTSQDNRATRLRIRRWVAGQCRSCLGFIPAGQLTWATACIPCRPMAAFRGCPDGGGTTHRGIPPGTSPCSAKPTGR